VEEFVFEVCKCSGWEACWVESCCRWRECGVANEALCVLDGTWFAKGTHVDDFGVG